MIYRPEDDGAYRYTICSKTIAKAAEVAEFMNFTIRQWNWCPIDEEFTIIKDLRPWEGYR